MRRLLTYGLLLLLASCAGDPPGPRVQMEYDASVPDDQKDWIENDLENLRQFAFEDQEGKDLLGLDSISPSSIATWLSDRVKYVVGESYNENANVVPLELDPTVSSVTVMSNLGGGLYRPVRNNKRFPTIRVAGQNLKIDTPRVGIIQIGKGHFLPVSAGILSTVGSMGNSLYRLSTLFHEARHSDGNGDNAAFPHVYCPSGDYKGELACDTNSNGAYAVGVLMLKKLIEGCKRARCSMSDKVALMIIYADEKSRIIGTNVGDATPVKGGP